MKELQGLIAEADRYLEYEWVELGTPIIHAGMLYDIPHTACTPIGIVRPTIGRIQTLDADYRAKKVGIGTLIPEIPGFSDLLRDVQSAASKIVSIQEKHQRTMDAMTWLCFRHVINEFQLPDIRSTGGVFRIQITAQEAVCEILFPLGHGIYAPSYQVDLWDIVEGHAFREKPFSYIPPDYMIPSALHSWRYTPLTYEAWTALLKSMPLNTKKHKMYRSRTADVFADFKDMAEELLVS